MHSRARTFPRAAEKNGEDGEKTKDQRKLGPASYCARIRSSCERKSMKPRMGNRNRFQENRFAGISRAGGSILLGFISSAVPSRRYLDLRSLGLLIVCKLISRV